MDKQSLRRYIRALKREQAPERLAAWSDLLAQRLETHPWFVEAQAVLLFAALPDEPETRPLLARHAKDKRLYLPAVAGDDIVVRQYRNEADLRQGAFGIDEPVGESLSDLSVIDLVVVPGVAFDNAGNRLGRGRGYYDRLFARPDLHARRLGYAFPFQLVSTVPADGHDAPMDDVIRLSV